MPKRLKPQNFVHLHNHSEYSFLDSVIKIKGLGTTLKSRGFNAYAMTEHGNINGVYEFVKELTGVGIKPIVGCEFYIVPDRYRRGLSEEEKTEAKKAGKEIGLTARQSIKELEDRLGIRRRSHVVCLAKNNAGWRKLIRAVELAHKQGFYYFPRIDYDILEKLAPDVIVLTACVGGVPGQMISRDMHNEALAWTERMLKRFGSDFFMEIQPNDVSEQVKLNLKLIDLARTIGSSIVATNDVHYINPDDYETHDVLLAIRESQGNKSVLVTDENRFRYPTNQLYLKSRKEMEKSFQKFHPGIHPNVWIDALNVTMEIADRIEPNVLEYRKGVLPKIKIEPEYDSPDDKLWFLVKDGWKWRKINKKSKGKVGVIDWVDGELPREAPLREVYTERVRYEMDEITRLGFSRYFLVIWDLVRWARRKGIRVGPGRGSVGGSLVAFLLGVTSLDSVKYSCPFSRFISPDRIDYPDVDIDFSGLDRDRIVRYLTVRYGRFKVAGISTFGHMRGKSVLKDVGRVHGVPWQKTETVTKLVIQRADADERVYKCLEDTFSEFSELQWYKNKWPHVVNHAIKLEGNVRQHGVHAAGLVISDEPLRNLVPVQYQKSGSGEYLTSWDKRMVEAVGLLKLDILGIDCLQYIQRCLDLVKRQTGQDIEPENWDELDDKLVYQNFAQGNTELVWQMNQFGAIRLLKRLKPSKFDHIVATTSLIRPGPQNAGITDEYVKRRHGEKTESLHPMLDEILENTHGLMVYQEDVIKVVHDIGGFTWGEADRIRKDIGKKKGVEYLKKTYLDRFVLGAARFDISEQVASNIWNQIAEFGQYGFNKCLTGDTLLYRAGANKNCKPEVSIEELFGAQNEPTPWGRKIRAGKLNIIQMDEDGRMRPGRLKKIYHNGKRKVTEIRTYHGRCIKCTPNHRLLTNTGYKTVVNLTVGDYLVCMGNHKEKKPAGNHIRGKGKKYKARGSSGVPFGRENPGWIDGRSVAFKQAKIEVYERANQKCEECGTVQLDSDRFEFAHIDSLESCNGDYHRYHSSKNLRYYCNSCHKKFDYRKGERKKRWTKGRPATLDEIVSINYCGTENVYDIEMETVGHNFVANGIVSHNSHATGYSILSYWTMYLKIYYPLEFMTAALETVSDAEKNRLYIREAKRLGLTVTVPDVNVSGFGYSIDYDLSNTIRAGLVDIKGVGAKTVDKVIAGAPYNSFRDFLDRSGTNKTAIVAFLRVGALDGLVDNPKYIEENIVEILKYKSRKKEHLKDRYWNKLETEGKLSSDQSIGKYTASEREKYRLELASLPPDVHPARKAVDWLTEKCEHITFQPIARFESLFNENFSGVHYAFVSVVTKVNYYEETRPATQNSETAGDKNTYENRVARVNIEDDTGAIILRTNTSQLQRIGTSGFAVGKTLMVIGHGIGFWKLGAGEVINLESVKGSRRPVEGTPEHFILRDPFAGFREFLNGRVALKTFEQGKRKFRICVYIVATEVRLTKKHKNMMIVLCQDCNGAFRDVVIWPSDYATYAKRIKAGTMLLLHLKSKVEEGKARRYFLNTNSGKSAIMPFEKYYEANTE